MQKPELLDPLDDWEEWYAPVVPPTWVKEEARRTLKPVDWNNSQTASDVHYPMLYRTKFENGVIVTHLLPGSCKPCEGWLTRTPR